MFRVSVLCAIFALSTAAFTKLELTECGGNGNIRVNEADVSPMPVKIPGHISATVDVDLSQTISDGAELKIEIYSKTWLLGWVKIPVCIPIKNIKIGSCTYNVCNFLSQFSASGCPKQVTDLGLECPTCPLTPMNHRYVLADVDLPPVPGVLGIFAKGDYKVKGNLRDQTGDLVACYEGKFSISS
ncbi:uncharacterized protein LOC135488250 [Lineus longissimus]|uniref:uncharacterized protein LOC135488250 n=1 Tax=Lineus longissimus TaxID=88925 RepID=UPI002B4C3875